MSIERITWGVLPHSARAAVQECTGPVIDAADVNSGMNSGLATKLRTQHGAFFVKGIELDHRLMAGHNREAAVNPFLPPSSPKIRWHVQAAGWDLIGFDLVAGRAADFTPGSPDLPLVVKALKELGDMPTPSIALMDCARRYESYGPAPELFSGAALLHTDINAENVLIDDKAGTAHIVDWAWPTKGARFIDPGVWLLRLIAAGHTAAEAEAWAERLPAWSQAPSEALTAFAEASRRLWDEIAEQAPNGSLWQKEMQAAAAEFAEHRASKR